MQQLEYLGRAAILLVARKLLLCGGKRSAREYLPASPGEDVRRAHPAQIRNETGQRPVRDFDPIHIDDRHSKTGSGEQLPERRGLDPRMNARDRFTRHRIGGAHGGAKAGQGIAARNRADQKRVGAHRVAQPEKRAGQIVDGVEHADDDGEIEASRVKIERIRGRLKSTYKWREPLRP